MRTSVPGGMVVLSGHGVGSALIGITFMQHDESEPDLPIILLPGLNGDARVFGPQAMAFPSMTIGRWIPPTGSEGLADYAKRLARVLDPGRPCVVGGVSFGGIVAMEIARHLQARACVLIASSRDVDGMPAVVRLLRPIASVIPPPALASAIRCGWASAAPIVPACGRRVARLTTDEMTFRRWAIQSLITWRGASRPNCPVLQIHGQNDDTFAASRSKADLLIPGAGHMLTLAHAAEVNEFLRSAVRRCAA